jgi:hypothetical protein
VPEPQHQDRALAIRQGAHRADQLVPVVLQADDVRRGSIGERQAHPLVAASTAAPVPA